MSWYDKNFKYRYPVAIDNTGAAGNYDCEWVVSSKWPAFWDNILASGFDIYPISNTGAILPFERTGYSLINKTLTLSIDAMQLDAASINIAWIYWGNPSAVNASAPKTMTGPKAGAIYLGKPKNMVVGPQSFIGGASNPVASFYKNASSRMYAWFNVRNLLSTRWSPYQEHNDYETIKNIVVTVLDKTGAVQAAMIDQSKTRFVPGFVGVYVQSGTDGSNYQIKLKITTSEQQEIFLTALLMIRDQLPS